MTPEEIEEGNHLMAIFLGGVVKGNYYHFPKYVCPPFNSITITDGGENIMKFHCDWNWLMVVLTKTGVLSLIISESPSPF